MGGVNLVRNMARLGVEVDSELVGGLGRLYGEFFRERIGGTLGMVKTRRM